MPILSILIPRYKENEEVLRFLLDSIKMQQGVNLKFIEVIIGQDGLEQDDLDTWFVYEYNKYFPINYVKFEHGGVSATRNKLMDICHGEYIQFCDADDLFSSVLALKLIIEKIIAKKFDILFSTFTEELYVPSKHKKEYVLHEDDSTFVHGKVVRKQFLIDNNIRWNNKLTVHEDSYFYAQCYHCSAEEKREIVKQSFYIWKWREGSVVRSDPKWMLNTYDKLIDSNEALIDNFLSRGMIKQVRMFSFIATMNLYYNINKSEYMSPENAKRLKEIEKRFKKFYVKYVDYMNELPADQQQRFTQTIRDRACTEGLMMEHITLIDWVRHILNLEG